MLTMRVVLIVQGTGMREARNESRSPMALLDTLVLVLVLVVVLVLGWDIQLVRVLMLVVTDLPTNRPTIITEQGQGQGQGQGSLLVHQKTNAATERSYECASLIPTR